MIDWTTLAIAAEPPPAPAPAAEPAPMSDGLPLLITLTLILMIGSCGLLMAEFVLFTGGWLIGLSGLCAIVACVMAFHISFIVGLVAIFVCPCLALWIGVTMFRRMHGDQSQRNTLAAADTGIHQIAARLGIAVGMEGTLLADALPAAMARFPAAQAPHEIEVMVIGKPLTRGAKIRVVSIDGMQVSVAPA
jgi:membrane protein implicated in regulation of membrane protease activity